MRLNHFFAASLLLFCSALSSAYALNPNLPPGSNFDLSHWYLQLPTSHGILTAASGTVDSASTAQLVAGFTNAYFYTAADGSGTEGMISAANWLLIWPLVNSVLNVASSSTAPPVEPPVRDV